MPEVGDNIRDALAGFANGSLRESTVRMLSVLGYQSDRIHPAEINDIRDFLDLWGDDLREKDACLLTQFWSRVEFIFQYTADELRVQSNISVATDFEKGRIKSFLFVAVDLKYYNYPRGRLAKMARIANQLFPMPVILIYRYDKAQVGRVITVAVTHRRPHKREPSRDVLEKVTLIRDIQVIRPHRAHIDILSELSLHRPTQVRNFDELHAKWESVLSIEPLNKRFYKELFGWFERAVSQECTWPPDADTEQQVIRFVTRILFVWFIRERGLVSESWFDQEKIKNLLHNFGGSDYYRAVLQNLFFATLNVPIQEREWNEVVKSDSSHASHWLYRDLIRQVEHFERLMAQTPFINGGLFDCLDSERSDEIDGRWVDMFNDSHELIGIATDQKQPAECLDVPDALFFDDEGLFPLLNRYKFTVEENTPTEIEVALDPELLGQVFENLLAAYNPETRNTARKETGSYYTPREVVDYMVDETLIAVLSDNVPPEDGDLNSWEKRLRVLFDYEDTGVQFEERDRKNLIGAISNLKILDPAVGSGAFPMAILHKLTLALRHLDPDNDVWEQIQKDAASKKSSEAYETIDRDERDRALLEISETFDRYSGDFGRKLYLIQNSIYGVDIQAIACQITKLRFFISLAIEQEPNSRDDNFGIKPLPNLETRFVAADSLLKVDRKGILNSERAIELETNLRVNRERHFHANTQEKKLECMQADRELRASLLTELNDSGFPQDSADQLARWDPYDQNDVSPWFDQEYMFGVSDGFDVVIGNPPYISLQRNSKLGKLYKPVGYSTYTPSGDVYQLFYERGCELLRRGGSLAYITSNSWLRADYGKCLREFLTSSSTPLQLLDVGKDVFEANVDTSILILQNQPNGNIKSFEGVDVDRFDDDIFPPPQKYWGQIRPRRGDTWRILTDIEWGILEKMQEKGKPLKDWKGISIYMGIKTGYNKAFIVDTSTRESLIDEDYRSAEILKPVLRGRDIQRYRANWDRRWLITAHNGYGDIPPVDIGKYPAIKNHLDQFYEKLSKRQDQGNTPYNLRNCAYHGSFSQEKLFLAPTCPSR